MKVELTKPSEATAYNITNACGKIMWKGTDLSAGREAQFDYVNAPFDSTIKLPTVAIGDYLSLVDDDEGEVFYGQIFATERSSQTGTITYTAYDMTKHMLESKGQYNFKNITPEAIAAQVCADVQMPVRNFYATGVNIASMICDNMSLYDIIMAAYTKAHRITGDKYFWMVYKRGCAVYKSEWLVKDFVLSDSSNIYSSDITESMSDVINRVKIFDKAGTQIGEVSDADSISKLGIFQDIYQQEDGVDAQTAAKAKLKVKPVQTIKMSAVGDINCLSCYFVKLHDAATGLDGKYWIASDTHTWDNGVHTMELELRFDSMMDTKESSKETEGGST